MSNGIHNSFSMGFNWCCLVLAFASVIALGDFSSSDSQNLYTIKERVAVIQQNSDTMKTYLSNIYQDTSNLGVISDSLQTSYGSVKPVGAFIEQMGDDIHSMLSVFVYSNSEWYVNSRDISLEKTANSIDSKLGVVTNQNNEILAAVNNLTNYLCYSSSYLPTNFPALLTWATDDSMFLSNATELFRAMYGRYPSSNEKAWIEYTSRSFGLWKLPFISYLLEMPYDSLTESQSSEFESLIYSLGFNWNGSKDILANQYYDLYGTRQIRQLLDTSFEAITNDANFSVEVTGTTNSSYSSGFVQSAMGLAGDAISSTMVDSKVATVETNAISNIANNSFSTPLQEIQQGLNAAMSSDLSDAVGQIASSFQEFLPNVQNDDTFELDFGSWTLFGSDSVDIKLTLHKIPDSITKLIHYVFLVIRLGVVFTLAFDIWRFMCAETAV